MAVLWLQRRVYLFVRKSHPSVWVNKKMLFVLYLELFPKLEIGLKRPSQNTNEPDSGMHTNSTSNTTAPMQAAVASSRKHPEAVSTQVLCPREEGTGPWQAGDTGCTWPPCGAWSKDMQEMKDRGPTQ